MRRYIIIGAIILIAIVGFLVIRNLRGGSNGGADGAFQTEPAQTGSLTASVGATGIVRSNQNALLTWQTNGTVGEVLAILGDQVESGDRLASLSQTSLPQSVILAEAELVSAQQALEDLNNSRLAQAQAEQALKDAREALDGLNANFAIHQSQIQLSLANAEDDLQDAEYRWRVRQEGNRASGDTIDAAEANLVLAEREVDKAQDIFNDVSGKADNNPRRALAISNLVAAKNRRDDVLRQLNWYTGRPTELDQAILDAEVAIAQAQLEDAQFQWEQAKDGPSSAEINLLEAQVADAEREWERIKDGPTDADITAAEARVAAAQATLDLAILEAPFAGTITDSQIKVGDQIAPGSVAFRLDDLSHLLVDVEVSEVDINRIIVGQPVVLTFDAVLGEDYTGVVQEVGVVGSQVQGTVSFIVTVELSDPNEAVKPGMTAAVNIVVNELTDVLLVPNRAVRIRDGNRVVFVLKDGVPEAVRVTLGASSEITSEVIAGDLEAGDLIVLNPPAENNFFGGPPGGGPGGP